MTCLTFGACYGVIGGFRGAVTYPVMTTRIVAAKAYHFGIVVIKHSDNPIGGVVAFTAVQRRGQVIGTFAGGNYAVVATLTRS